MKYFMILLVIVLFAFETLFYIQMLQQNSYNEKNRFLKFTLKNIKENINYFALKLLFGISLILFANFEFILYVYFFLIMFILIYSSVLQYKKYNKKLPLKFTKRVIRIFSLDIISYLILMIICFNKNLTFLLGIELIFISLLPFVLIILNYILSKYWVYKEL